MTDVAAAIDTLEFARSGLSLEGEVDVANLKRLTDGLYDTGGRLKYRLKGGRDNRDRPRIKLAIDGEIHLRCQRCLNCMPYTLAVKSDLLVLTAGDTAAESTELDDLDGVPAEPHADVSCLVEDEALLALPLAPRHPEGLCSAVINNGGAGSGSPFAVLGNLKSGKPPQQAD